MSSHQHDNEVERFRKEPWGDSESQFCAEVRSSVLRHGHLRGQARAWAAIKRPTSDAPLLGFETPQPDLAVVHRGFVCTKRKRKPKSAVIALREQRREACQPAAQSPQDSERCMCAWAVACAAAQLRPWPRASGPHGCAPSVIWRGTLFEPRSVVSIFAAQLQL